MTRTRIPDLIEDQTAMVTTFSTVRIGSVVGDPVVADPDHVQVCVQLRDQYLAYPGISRAALAMAPGNPDIARVSEAMFSIVLAGGIEPQTAAWSIDALALYVAGYALERFMNRQQQKDPDATWVLSR